MTINAMRIETLIAEQCMTKAAYAQRCGVSRQSISTIIRRGTCEPRTAGKLAAGLGVPVAEILKEEAYPGNCVHGLAVFLRHQQRDQL